MDEKGARIAVPAGEEVVVLIGICNGGVLWTRGLSILQLVVLEGR